MLRSVKNENRAVHCESGNQVGVLRTVAGLVDFTRVVDSLHDFEPHGSCIGGSRGFTVATNLTTVVIIVAGIRAYVLGYLDLCDLNMIGLSI